MTAQEKNQEKIFLPKEPLEIPSYSEHKSSSHNYNIHDVKTLLSWSAPGRPFRKRTKQYYLTAILITLLVEVILFLFGQTVLMGLAGSVMFLAFALSSVSPRNFHYRISTEGITVEDHFFLWQELYDFYFRKQHGEDVLTIRSHSFFPGELTITMGQLNREHLKSALLPYLPYREYIKPTFMEKSGEWLARNFPLEKN